MLALAAPFATALAHDTEKVPVELWTGGDDGLTQKFAGSLHNAVAASSTLENTGVGHGALRMEIPTHLYWKKAQERTHFQYVVILVDAHGRYVGSSIGGCWESDMDNCATRVVADASTAWTIHRRRLDALAENPD